MIFYMGALTNADQQLTGTAGRCLPRRRQMRLKAARGLGLCYWVDFLGAAFGEFRALRGATRGRGRHCRFASTTVPAMSLRAIAPLDSAAFPGPSLPASPPTTGPAAFGCPAGETFNLRRVLYLALDPLIGQRRKREPSSDSSRVYSIAQPPVRSSSAFSGGCPGSSARPPGIVRQRHCPPCR